MTIDELAGGDILKWELILELPYISVLRKRQLNLAVSEYRTKYNQLITAEMERKHRKR